MRISRHQMFMEMARSAAKRSTCSRLNIGAIVTYNNSPVSVGWNGAKAGEAHCPGNTCAGMTPGGCPTIHAEVNALKKANEILKNPQGGYALDLYTTHSPCPDCCKAIRDSRNGVARIFFETPYRLNDHLRDMFSGNYLGPYGTYRETELYEVTPAGYVVGFFSRWVVEIP